MASARALKPALVRVASGSRPVSAALPAGVVMALSSGAAQAALCCCEASSRTSSTSAWMLEPAHATPCVTRQVSDTL